MQKVIIIGCPGSGKSTFARALHELTELPLYHLDLMYWNPDRTRVPKAQFRQALEHVLSKDRWILDGNYASTIEQRLAVCDTVFFLDYPTEVCLAGRAARMGKSRADMPWFEVQGEPADQEFLEFIQNYQKESKPVVMELLAKYADREIHIFHKREDADCYLQELKNR